jgi:hypothetical protein
VRPLKQDIMLPDFEASAFSQPKMERQTSTGAVPTC